MWWIAPLVLGIVILVLALLLLIPVDLVFSVERDENLKMKARVGWMFGLVRKEFPVGKKEKPEKKPKGGKRNLKSVMAALTTEGFAQKLLGYLRNTLGVLKIRDLKANWRIGLGDPVDTSMLFALIAPTMVFVRSFSSVNVEVEPDFDTEKLQGYCMGSVRAMPIRVVGVSIPFVLSPTTIRALRAMRRAGED